MTLHERLAKVMGQIGRVAKDAKAPAQMGGFQYATEADVYDAVRPHLAEAGISVQVRVQDFDLDTFDAPNGKRAYLAKGLVHVTYHAYGESLENIVPMYAIDYGDKAAQKLLSNAVKYAVLKSFLVSTGQDDAESAGIEAAPTRRPGRVRFNARGPEPVTRGQRKRLSEARRGLEEAGIPIPPDAKPPGSALEAETLIERLVDLLPKPRRLGK